ncbi:chloride channel protein CLC-a-like [Silene latifolia]|uniref:chloride channel protein CLC-a-like n=1 Tax=Silene latifolia TaxID=37657 RepID=UPI003D786DCF
MDDDSITTQLLPPAAGDEERPDIENNAVDQSHLRRRKMPVRHMAMVGAEISNIESLDYEINENPMFKQDWRTGTKTEVFAYVCYKWLLAFLVGLLTGLVAVVINLAVENIAGYKFLLASRFIEDKRYVMGFIILAGINFSLTLIAACLCAFFSPAAAGPGIPEIKAYLNGIDTPNMYGFTTLLVKFLGTIAAVPASLDLGKEGPLVHIATCIAALLGQGGTGKYQVKWPWLRYMNNDRDQRDLITYGASSGVCAAFRSPVGGILFSVEEVATWWRSALLWRTFFSTAIVVVVLRCFTEYCSSGGRCGLFNGGLIMFDVSDADVHYHASDIIPVILIGVFGGILGSLYNYVLIKVIRLYSLINEKGKLAKIVLSVSVSLFTSVTMYGLPFLVSCTKCDSSPGIVCPTSGRTGNFKQFNCPDGYYNDLASLLFSTNDDAVRNIFSTNTPSEYHVVTLLLFFGIYCILGLITFAIAVPSGLFLPIILMGSAYGRLIGIIMNSKMDQGLFAILGAASLMAGSMRMTVSVCAIFLELTNNLLLLPITMFVLLISKGVGDYFNPSIYDLILELKGLPFLDAKPEPWMTGITVGELIEAKPPLSTLNVVEKVGRILDALKNTTHNAFPVIELGNPPREIELRGLILRAHLLIALKKKWFLEKPRRTEEQEVRKSFTSIELAERDTNLDQIQISNDEMEMYIDLHPFVNKTPYTVTEDMSVAKAMMLFRTLALRHLLIVPKYRFPGICPVTGILTRQDLRADNILCAFPHLEKFKET